MTTAQAALYCGFKTTAAIRKVLREGRLAPPGRSGGSGTYMWSRHALDAFLAGVRISEHRERRDRRIVNARIGAS
jgi:hypothetical protein